MNIRYCEARLKDTFEITCIGSTYLSSTFIVLFWYFYAAVGIKELKWKHEQ